MALLPAGAALRGLALLPPAERLALSRACAGALPPRRGEPSPGLRIYGYLDGLVPRKVAELLDADWPNSTSQIVAKAAHAPFISHPDEFVTMIEAFIAAH